ncbi:hypothetical protein COLO4_27562 [Corchorus olitorius]|uniref:Uncharacterized protein n=1 Tax=Corchorus olitorius TaxID=93759 RepID=A0A1R3HR19_9ROSI|nr:hypothetical protein COLO4_27562 [Corchorus olitorius]
MATDTSIQPLFTKASSLSAKQYPKLFDLA